MFIRNLSIFLVLVVIPTTCLAQPYWGTIFVDPDIITSADSSAILSTTYTGQGTRTTYDRRTNSWVVMNAYLFDVVWNDGLTSEAQVNPEFGSVQAAQVEAEKYGRLIGQLPTCLRVDVNSIWIHKGTEAFGGGNYSILIHTGQSASYEAQGILEETLVHEASHTSLDSYHKSTSGWLAAQAEDTVAISSYARDNPTREDIAESFLMWLAIRHRPDSISQLNYDLTTGAIPNRIAYFDDQDFDLYPFVHCTETFSNMFVNTCVAYTSPSGNYTWEESGVYNDTLVDEEGCNTIVRVTLTKDDVDASVSIIENTLHANADDVAYSWLDCNNNYDSIHGETSNEYTAISSGTYALEVTQDGLGCIDTSECIYLDVTEEVLNVDQTSLAQNITVYPNPTSGILNLKVLDTYTTVNIVLRDISGRTITSMSYSSVQDIVIDIEGESGMYSLEVSTNFEIANYKILKQ